MDRIIELIVALLERLKRKIIPIPWGARQEVIGHFVSSLR